MQVEGASSSLRLCPVGSCAQCFLHDHVRSHPMPASSVHRKEMLLPARRQVGTREPRLPRALAHLTSFPLVLDPRGRASEEGGVRGRRERCAQRGRALHGVTRPARGQEHVFSPRGREGGKTLVLEKGGATGKSLQWAASLLPGWHPGS